MERINSRPSSLQINRFDSKQPTTQESNENERRGGEEEARTRRTQTGIAQKDHTTNPGGHEEVRASCERETRERGDLERRNANGKR